MATPILLDARELTAAFGARALFEGVSFTIGAGERIGLIGPNGAGKSTLLRILAGAMAPDGGTLSRRRGLRVALLEQAPTFAPGVTVREAIEQAIDEPGGEEAAHERLRTVLADLSLDGRGGAGGSEGGESVGPEAAVSALSGGWKKRVALGRALARGPDLLLLDEPTNHLDVESIEWLETFLTRGGGGAGAGAGSFATVTVTHDRLFLQRVANRILELDPRNAGGLLSVAGDYADYVRVKGETMHAQERREVVLRNTLRRETEWLRRGAAARTTKQQARIARAGTIGDEVAELGRRNQVRSASVDFQSSERQPRRLIEARGIGKRYGERTIFAGVDLRLGPGTRLGLLGPNGCGKSTLIRVLVGEEAPSTGDVLRADGLAVAYFQQSREALDPELSVVDTLAPDGDHVTFRGARVHVRGYLERFLFRSEQLEMAVGRLSGGEQSRLLLAKLMLREAQVLVLDEPTNDLDLATLAVLEEALSGFDGAVLLVTHDRYFLDQVATSILAFMRTPAEPACERDAYAVVPFANLSQWEVARAEAASAKTMTAKTATAKAATETASGSQAASSSSAGAPAASARRRLGYLEQREYEGIEAEITRIEAVLREARVESDRPENASDAAGLMTLLATIAEREAALERLYARWAELEAKLTSTS